MTIITQPVFQPDLPLAPQAMQRRFEHKGLTWVDFMHPSGEQVAFLRERFQFHQLHLDDLVSRLQRPKLDDNDEPNYIFMVLHFPVFDSRTRMPTVSEIDFFVGPNFVVTAHDGRLKAHMRILQSAAELQQRQQMMERGPGFLLYKVIANLLNACMPMLLVLDEKLDRLDEGIFTEDVQKMVRELSFLRRDVITMRRILRPNMPVIHSLANRERGFLRLDEEAYFGDLTDILGKLWDLLEEQKEIIEGLDATISSLTSHRINQEMKIFTLISVIILPMTLVASILGMNVSIPLAEHPLALPISLIIMCILACAMFAYFRWQGWI